MWLGWRRLQCGQRMECRCPFAHGKVEVRCTLSRGTLHYCCANHYNATASMLSVGFPCSSTSIPDPPCSHPPKLATSVSIETKSFQQVRSAAKMCVSASFECPGWTCASIEPHVTKTFSAIDDTVDRIWQPQVAQNWRVTPGELLYTESCPAVTSQLAAANTEKVANRAP
jgi:hypothetical protein